MVMTPEEHPGGEGEARLGHAGDREGQRGEGGEVDHRCEQRGEQDGGLAGDVRPEPPRKETHARPRKSTGWEPQECDDHGRQGRGGRSGSRPWSGGREA